MTADGVVVAGIGHAPRRDRFQHLVASFVAVAVVDVLEIVQVDEHDHQTPVMPSCLSQAMFQPVVEQRAVVGKAGQLVMEGGDAGWLRLAP